MKLLHKKEQELQEFKGRVMQKRKSSAIKFSFKQEKYAQNEFERATSWGRSFGNFYSELKWLNAFASLNRIAMQHSVGRMSKNYLKIKDNLIDKQLLLRLKQKYCPTLYAQSSGRILLL